MAEIVKAKKKKQIVKIDEKEQNKNIRKKTVDNNKKEKDTKKNNKSLWDKFMIFCHGVKGEVKKIRWTSKQDMIKYSIATIVFIIFCSLFFYAIDTIFALVQSIFNK